jgi:hypothetical protein
MELTGSGAVISADQVYRYHLNRYWASELHLGNFVLWIMLNPSTADADLNDPTITRCMGFARMWGFSGIEVVNLFGYRATDPDDLLAAHRAGTDVVGPDNDEYVASSMHRAGICVAAWGAHRLAGSRSASMLRIAHEQGRNLFHLGDLTKDGHPRHPLYLAAATELEEYR